MKFLYRPGCVIPAVIITRCRFQRSRLITIIRYYFLDLVASVLYFTEKKEDGILREHRMFQQISIRYRDNQ